MILGRVTGSVVSTIKDRTLHGQKLLIVQPVDIAGKKAGVSFLALDRVSAGKGDRVIVNREGGGTKLMFGAPMPVQAVIVAVVDQLQIDYHGE
ncbi:MAG: EutN/CcmL family microcompartment protein [Candidatus Neomarinimicrobiota bacterium]